MSWSEGARKNRHTVKIKNTVSVEVGEGGWSRVVHAEGGARGDAAHRALSS